MKSYDIMINEKTCVSIDADFCVVDQKSRLAIFRDLQGQLKGVVNLKNIACVIFDEWECPEDTEEGKNEDGD